MKKTSKIFSVVLALVLVFAMAIPAFAAETWTGSITLNSAKNVSVDGKLFKAYKILDAEAVDVNNLEAGVIYSIPAAMQSFYDGLCGGADNVATVAEVEAYLEADTTDLQDFAVEALAAAKTAGVTAETATGADDKATFTDLPFGYYVIEDTANEKPVSALMLRTTSKEVTIKADKPSIEKKIDEDSDYATANDRVDANNAAIGDDVSYVLTSKVPAMEGYDSYSYVVTDTFSTGLTYNDDVAITIDGTALTKDTDYTATYDAATQKLTITFVDFIENAELAGKDIVITYSAKINADAVVGETGNPNTVSLEYSNNPQDSTSKENTPDDIVITYTTKVSVNKVDKDGNALAGATFELQKKGDDDNYAKVADAVLNDAGTTFTWSGLEAGDYKLVETDAPAGYNTAEDIYFTIACTVPGEVDAATDTADWTLTVAEGSDATFTEETGTFSTNVVNLTGGLLPETGGIGTTIFYIVGIVLVLGAAVLLITKKRMSCEA